MTLRRITLAVLFCLLLAPASSLAQRSLGSRFGLNVSTVKGDLTSPDQVSSRIGFVAGLTSTIELRYALALQIEILYSQKGYRSKSIDLVGADDVPATIELTYLETPLLLAYQITLSRSKTLKLYAGPSLGFEIAEQIVFDDLQSPQPINAFKSPDLGLAVGIDYSFPFIGTQATIGARFSRSGSNVAESPEDATRSIYNQAISLFGGLRF